MPRLIFDHQNERNDKGKLGKPRNKEEEFQNLFLGIMEGDNDSLIPPLSYSSTPEIPNYEEYSQNSRKRQTDEPERKQSEHRRRDQMNEKISLLQSTVPSLLTVSRLIRSSLSLLSNW